MASLLMVLALVTHGPIHPDLDVQMTRVADRVTRWTVIHWLAAAALSSYAVAGLIVLTAGSRLTRGRWTVSAWAVVLVGALWTMTTAVAEATVIVEAARAGASQTFEAWWAFAEGKGSGFCVLALAIAVIAANEARSPERSGPAWVTWVAVVASIGSFAGWALGIWVGLAPARLLWVACSVVMSLWTLGFGVALARSPVGGD